MRNFCCCFVIMAALRRLASPLWRVSGISRLSPSAVNGEALLSAAGKRALSTTNSLRFQREIEDPCHPLSYQPSVWNYEIQELTEKAKGPWKDMTVEEIRTMYNYFFFETVEDEIRYTGEWIRVLGMMLVLFGMTMYIYMFQLRYLSPGGPRRKTLTYRWYFKRLEHDAITREDIIEGELAEVYKQMQPDLEKRREKARAELQLEERFRKRVEERLARVEAEKNK